MSLLLMKSKNVNENVSSQRKQQNKQKKIR